MKRVVYILALLFLFTLSCTEQVEENQVNEIQIVDLSKYNMKIIPEKPTSEDEIRLVVLEDCKYNILSGIIIKDKIIDIEKQFNGMMKWPCVLHNDTILIGTLPLGLYRVNYKLIDIANPNSPQISQSVSFTLPVSVGR